MNGDISIDLGSAVPYAVESVLSLFGKDALSRAANERLQKRIRLSLAEATKVQCIGMDKPIPLAQIYQPTRLRQGQFDVTSPSIAESDVTNVGNIVIFGRPGAGKTTLMRFLLMKLLHEKHTVPLLFTLRSQEALEDLFAFVEDLSDAKVVATKRERVVLLVDGYDEIDFKTREKVSHILRQFSSLDRGNFILTCRLYYTIVDLTANYYYIEPFTPSNAKSFAAAFFEAYGARYDVDELVVELTERGFGDFLTSPLMLALVCILKTGPLPNLPRNTVGLIRRALDTLTFRWDEAKGISRTGDIPLDGEERIRCLMRIAYHFKQPSGSEAIVFMLTERHLKILQRTDVSVPKLLEEIAQWYGVFVPISDGQWAFVHRTLHDFLAARYWVESGGFSDVAITNTGWNTRTAYAACLIPDATRCLVKSLIQAPELHVLVECLANNAPFDPDEVAKALVKCFGIKRFRTNVQFEKTEKEVRVVFYQDFFRLVTDEFLSALVHAGAYDRTEAHDIVYSLALSEEKRRGHKLKYIERADFLDLIVRAKRGGQEIEQFVVKDLL